MLLAFTSISSNSNISTGIATTASIITSGISISRFFVFWSY